MKAKINAVESFGTKDGDGIRFVVFFQGCHLRCSYCHNPQTWNPAEAVQELSVKELTKNILNYKDYFGQNGGVTLSGGEPLLQAEFLVKLCKKLKRKGIHIILDTSGAVITPAVKKVLKYINKVILDVKFAKEEDYKKHCGGSLTTTVAFLELLEQMKKTTWVRTVVVPGINDTKESILQYVEKLKGFTCIEKYELLAFHTMAFAKYKELGFVNRLENTAALTEKKREQLQKTADTLFKEK